MTTMRLTILAALALSAAACTNPETPAGHEGYVFHRPLVFGKLEYKQTLRGPASTGMSWRRYVVNVDMRARSYVEKFGLLTKDNLSVSFEVTTRIELAPGSVRQVVEDWGADHWYEHNVKEPLRTVVRRSVTEVSAPQIQLETTQVGQAIYTQLVEKYKDTPFRVLSVDIGNIAFPQEVTDAIQQKIAKEQELERQEYVLQKTRKEAAIKVLEALKVAKQQRIISSTLDPLYVQRRAVEVYRAIAHSPNKTVVVLPNTADGTGLPLVLQLGRPKTVSVEEDRLLRDMETKYMIIAQEGQGVPMPPPDAPLGATDAPAPKAPPAAPSAPAPKQP
jgi:regulator of protease activity HflC (stomatin/prohibitin superfamily)